MKKNLLFGRLYATLAIAVCAMSVNGQALKLESNRGFGLVPSTMTANGKARITAVADDGMHIYNTNFLQEKVINYTGQKYRSGYREETAEVTPTGAQISYYSTGGRAYIPQMPRGYLRSGHPDRSSRVS